MTIPPVRSRKTAGPMRPAVPRSGAVRPTVGAQDQMLAPRVHAACSSAYTPLAATRSAWVP